MGAQIYMTEREYKSVAYCVDQVSTSIHGCDNDDSARYAKLAVEFATDLLDKYTKKRR